MSCWVASISPRRRAMMLLIRARMTSTRGCSPAHTASLVVWCGLLCPFRLWCCFYWESRASFHWTRRNLSVRSKTTCRGLLNRCYDGPMDPRPCKHYNCKQCKHGPDKKNVKNHVKKTTSRIFVLEKSLKKSLPLYYTAL